MRQSYVRGAKQAQAGFTLIELMIVVAILGILAAVAVPMFGRYIYKSKTVEATSFLAEIRVRQESYRSDFDQYCDVSGMQTNWYPTGAPQQVPRAWGNNPPAGWQQLGAMPPGRMSLFSYSTVAGLPGTTPATAMGGDARGYNGGDFWFISSAFADMDGDGITVTYESYSHSKSIWTSNEGGWE